MTAERLRQQMRHALTDLERAVRAAGAGELLGQLAPGVPDETTMAAFAEIGLRPGPELLEWYAWHNGTISEPGTVMLTWLPAFSPQSLEQLLLQYRGALQDPVTWAWRPGWVPWLHSGSMVRVVAQAPLLDQPPEERPTPVRIYDPIYGGFAIADAAASTPQPSLTVPIRWWAEAISDGSFRYHPDSQRWDVDWYSLPKSPPTSPGSGSGSATWDRAGP